MLIVFFIEFMKGDNNAQSIINTLFHTGIKEINTMIK